MQGTPKEDSVLETVGVVKKFGSLVAVNGVDFTLRKGQIHALLGENGAGKSTLCNVLYGYLRPDGGEIRIKGKAVKFSSPKDAIKAGLGMVHQELMLIPNMNVLENLSLMTDLRLDRPVLELGETKSRLMAMEGSYGLQVNPEAIVENLSVGERQRVEILKCLFTGAEILIFDEPTSFLTTVETEKLFMSLKRMASEGRSILFVTHRIDEVLAIADHITVIKLGKIVASRPKEGLTKEDLAMMIVGREVMYKVEKTASERGVPVLLVKSVSANNDQGSPVVKDLSLEVNGGEILCIAGVAGNGQREIDEIITGMRKVTSGKVFVGGGEVTNRTPDDFRRVGVAHICEEHKTGFIFDFSLRDNLILSPFMAEKFTRRMFVDQKKLKKATSDLMKQYNVIARSEESPLRTLSGGNKQKFLLARELSSSPKVIVANNPTKGLDVAAAEYIRNVLMQERAKGTAILMISSDLDEVLDMGDRIAVLNRGSVMKVIDSKQADIREIGYLMTGTASAGPSS